MSKCGTTEFVSWFFSSEIVGLSPTLCLGFSVLVFCILAAATADRKDPSGCGKTTVYFPTGCTLGRHSEGDPGVPGVRNSQEDLAVAWQSEEE